MWVIWVKWDGCFGQVSKMGPCGLNLGVSCFGPIYIFVYVRKTKLHSRFVSFCLFLNIWTETSQKIKLELCQFLRLSVCVCVGSRA